MSEERRFGGRDHWQLWIALAAFCLTAAWFCWRVLWPSATTLTYGFGAYYSASRLLSIGELTAEIYDPDYFRPIVQSDSLGQVDDIYNANPPTTILILWPLSYLPIEQARLVWTLVNVVLLFAGLGLLFWAFGLFSDVREHRFKILFILSFGLLFQPVNQNFLFGQAYVLVFFLLSVTTAAFIRKQLLINQSTGGIALALALLLKTAGWPLLILLLWLRKMRFLAWIIGVSAIIFLATLPVFGLDMWLGYGSLLSEVGRSPLICVPAYQTTRSWLCHLFAPNVIWQEAETAGTAIPVMVTLVYVGLGILCLIGLLRLAKKRPETALMGFICWSILFLPLGEIHHHTVMLIPLAWIFARWGKQSRISRGMIVAAAVLYLIPFPVNAAQFQLGWLALLAYPYLAGAWLIFLGSLWDHKSEMMPGWG